MTLDYTSLQIHDVLVIKDEICFIVTERLSLALWRYNVDLNSMTPLFHWVKIASFCTVVVDRLIYVIGGRMLSDDSYSYNGIEIYSKNAPHSHSSTFDTNGHEWKEIAPLKEARMDAFGVSKNDEKIFIAGGLGGVHVWLNSCEVYNIATNEWQFIASLTVPRYCGKMVLIDETIFVLGGELPKPFKGSCYFPVGKVPVECYDEDRDKWNDKTTIPIDKIVFRENESASGFYFWLEFCSVRLFHPSSSKLSGLLPI